MYTLCYEDGCPDGLLYAAEVTDEISASGTCVDKEECAKLGLLAYTDAEALCVSEDKCEDVLNGYRYE